MERGEVWWAKLPDPVKTRPVLILSRTKVVEIREYVTIAEITSTIRNIPSEVSLGSEDDLPKKCVVNLDVINTIPKKLLFSRVTKLKNDKLNDVEKALKFALAIQ